MACAKDVKDTVTFIAYVKDTELVSDYIPGINLYTFDWRIGNYSMIKPIPESLTSPIFTVGPDKDMTLKFCLSPSKDNFLKIEVSLGKCYEAGCTKKERLSKKVMSLSFLDSNRKTLDYYSKLPFECRYVNTSKYYVWKREENISRFLDNDSLTIRAKLSLRFYEDFNEEKKPDDFKSIKLLLNDMQKLIDDNNMYADILIKVGGRVFKAHRAILFSHCPYLTKLIGNSGSDSPIPTSISSPKGCTENLQILHIPNENADVFLAVLHYIYCAKIYATDAVNDFGVYHFAKKYNLRELSMLLAPAEMYTHTQIKTVKVDFTWLIKNFSNCSNNAFVPIVSPIFKTNVGKEIDWNVLLYIFDSQNIFLSLQRVNGYDIDVQTVFKLSVCGVDGTQSDAREFKYLFTPKTMSNCHPGFLDSESRFVIDSSFLYNDTLTVCCELTLSDGDLIFETKNSFPGEYSEIDLSHWITNFENILVSGNYNDATLQVEEETFKIHKPILAARSPVFARMFENEMAEKLSGCVVIEDISSSAMKFALSYIYTGKLKALDMETAIELYRVGDKYDIQGLKEQCSNFIVKNMEADAACQVLILADLFDDEKLKKMAKNFVCRRASQALLTSHGQELMECYSHLAHDILESLSAVYCSLPPQDAYEKKEENTIQEIKAIYDLTITEKKVP